MPESTTSSTIARQQLDDFAQRVKLLRERLHQTVVGQDETLDLLLAKLDGASLEPTPSDRDVIFHHHLLHDFDPRKHH